MSNVANRSDDILLCARSLIVAGGYHGFSYADISKVIGIRNASIHYHFPSKTDLVRTLVARYREEAETGLAALERNIPDAAGQLRAYAGFWEACIADSTAPFCVCALLASQMPALPDEVVIEVRAHFRMLSAWLSSVMTRGAGKGSLRLAATADAEAEMFMAAIHGAMLSARAHGDAKVFGAVIHPLLQRLTARH
ncbi:MULTISPECIES: TetR/AcrR family transcriptional regulator [unclassified Bosea (in: a-proteobacteria)]|uniref:TetR/AcrR family transcriptional regulator n=1 Tax=unclassified Bosea (in: a-proteobacteria) TaxID=2653178 RepID=UPI000F756D28|nr:MULTISPECIES: TetR/AcrR family transcriptional regulator [unclassified Bosea (in: a-proteobacteria)]AZO80956.1 TetR family transcriptional regulator [Bosea sp. Tri-49]RXT25921.1 TetR family transcriptional regulator [Bosea sp. Tri-39]RXT31163.1 TetR family transcriptional regulator [Bosea sp. Tri-54]